MIKPSEEFLNAIKDQSKIQKENIEIIVSVKTETGVYNYIAKSGDIFTIHGNELSIKIR